MDERTPPLSTLEADIRSVTDDEIVPAAKVYQAAARSLHDHIRGVDPLASQAARELDLQAAVHVLSDLSHRRRGSVVVADVHGDLAGVGAIRIQDGHAHIAFLFVLPGFQDQGLGRRLLDRLAGIAADAGAGTMSLIASRDPRAWQRYLRLGLRPGPPVLSLRASNPRVLTDAPGTRLTAEDLDPDAPGHLDRIDALDLDIRGSRRRHDVESWLRGGDTGALLTDHASGSTIGYVVIGHEPDHIRIGPVACRMIDRIPDVMAHALHIAGRMNGASRHPWRVDLPAANHIAITPLLEAGFVIKSLQPWFANGEIGLWDRYIFRNEDEL